MAQGNCGTRFQSCKRLCKARQQASSISAAQLLDHLYFVESKTQRIEQEVAERLGPFQSEVARLCTIPEWTRLDRLGIASRDRAEHEAIPDAQHLASWAGLCRQSRERRQAQRAERSAKGIYGCVAAMPRGLGRLDKKNNYFVGSVSPVGSAKRIRNARPLRCPQAPGHYLSHLARRTCYSDLGADYFDRLNPEGLRRR